mgnify:CR=1 FL=1
MQTPSSRSALNPQLYSDRTPTLANIGMSKTKVGSFPASTSKTFQSDISLKRLATAAPEGPEPI